jgi:hypothetical protein
VIIASGFSWPRKVLEEHPIKLENNFKFRYNRIVNIAVWEKSPSLPVNQLMYNEVRYMGAALFDEPLLEEHPIKLENNFKFRYNRISQTYRRSPP